MAHQQMSTASHSLYRRRALLWAGIGLLWGLGYKAAAAVGTPAERPNFLLIIAEDMGPWLGCYGSELVRTPHLDALARNGIQFTNAWASGAACSPSRSSLFTGIWAPSLGTETHREPRPIPDWTIWTQYLRKAGYYATNNAKTDYNADTVHPHWWDESSTSAHYRNRPPGQPFFHVYSSLMQTHMSFLLDHDLEWRRHRTVSTESVRIPAYLPDEPTLKDDRAWHLHGVNLMDGEVGRILSELDRSGESARTIVIFFSDHGGVMPNAKGYANQAGFHIPLLIYIPPAFRHLVATTRAGTTHDGLVSLMDLPRTLFSLANIDPPAHLQGQALIGPHAGAHPVSAPYLFAYRGINGGRWDVVRSIRTGNLIYTRNYLAFRPAGIRQNYHMRMPGQQAYERLWRAGETNPTQSAFWQPRLPEELHNLAKDPEQLENLATDPDYVDQLERLRGLLDDHLEWIADIGFVPNTLRQPSSSRTFYDRMAADPELGRTIRKVAREGLVSSQTDTDGWVTAAAHASPSVRYWAAVGLARLAYAGHLRSSDALLEKLLRDPSDEVRTMAAEAVTAAGKPDVGLPILLEMVVSGGSSAREALSAIETLGHRAEPIGKDLLDLLNTREDEFYIRSALITLGILPYAELFR